MTFADAVAVRSQTSGVYAADVPAGWDIAGATNGGYLTALVTQAVLAETEALDPVTVTVHFFRAVHPGPVRIEVSPLRRGRRLSTATAVLSDADGELLLAALATVGSLPGNGGARSEPDRELIDASAPDLDPPESCILVEPTATFPPPFMAHVRLHLPADVAGFTRGQPSGRAQMRGWFGLPDDEPLDSLAVLLAADAFPPPVFNAALPIAWTPTVELTVAVRARPVGTRLRCQFGTRFVSGGFLEVDGELWDEAGAMVALSRQLALVPRG